MVSALMMLLWYTGRCFGVGVEMGVASVGILMLVVVLVLFVVVVVVISCRVGTRACAGSSVRVVAAIAVTGCVGPDAWTH